ncbi:MAG TPA: hypothetical protein VL652_34675 [Kutzneria sp.]|jgi:hypothetical protein|nr:hypothetical protein [Kutzneria sp.]
MSDERVWLQHPETGGHFECPQGAVEDWLAMGWVRADAPPEPVSPVVAEHLAAQQAAVEAAAQTQAPTKAAARGGSKEG